MSWTEVEIKDGDQTAFEREEAYKEYYVKLKAIDTLMRQETTCGGRIYTISNVTGHYSSDVITPHDNTPWSNDNVTVRQVATNEEVIDSEGPCLSKKGVAWANGDNDYYGRSSYTISETFSIDENTTNPHGSVGGSNHWMPYSRRPRKDDIIYIGNTNNLRPL